MIAGIFWEFISVVRAHPTMISVFGITCGILGHFISHRLAIGRDRRKEWLEVAQRVRASLLKVRHSLSPFDAGIDLVDADLLARMLPWLQRRGFRNAIGAYDHEREDCVEDSLGQPEYRQPSKITRAIDDLLSFTAKR